jgi:hypothetical protein
LFIVFIRNQSVQIIVFLFLYLRWKSNYQDALD